MKFSRVLLAVVALAVFASVVTPAEARHHRHHHRHHHG